MYLHFSHEILKQSILYLHWWISGLWFSDFIRYIRRQFQLNSILFNYVKITNYLQCDVDFVEKIHEFHLSATIKKKFCNFGFINILDLIPITYLIRLHEKVIDHSQRKKNVPNSQIQLPNIVDETHYVRIIFLMEIDKEYYRRDMERFIEWTKKKLLRIT